MVDIVSAEKRSLMMSKIRSKDTKPELLIRKGLHRKGNRYRLHDSKLPGRPDLVFPKWNAVLFVHGCFWHGHNCHLFRLPQTREEFWKNKIDKNIRRDRTAIRCLKEKGWRVAIVWECALKGKHKIELADTILKIENWLKSTYPDCEIRGRK